MSISMFGSLPRAIRLNCALLGITIGAGWLASSLSSGYVSVGTHHTPDGRGTLIHDAWYIATSNIRVVGMLLVGVFTFGALTIIELGWNGYLLGFGLSSLARSAPEYLPFLARYVPLEFLALVLAASASLDLSVGVLRCLVVNDRLPLWRVLPVLLLAIMMLVIAALIEAHVKQILGS